MQDRLCDRCGKQPSVLLFRETLFCAQCFVEHSQERMKLQEEHYTSAINELTALIVRYEKLLSSYRSLGQARGTSREEIECTREDAKHEPAGSTYTAG